LDKIIEVKKQADNNVRVDDDQLFLDAPQHADGF
jgi:hypothetical protein